MCGYTFLDPGHDAGRLIDRLRGQASMRRLPLIATFFSGATELGLDCTTLVHKTGGAGKVYSRLYDRPRLCFEPRPIAYAAAELVARTQSLAA